MKQFNNTIRDSRLSSVLTPGKSTARGILLVLVMFLMLFPFINTFNQLLVKVTEHFILFKNFQDLIIPYQVRVVRTVLAILSIPMFPGDPKSFSITLMTARGDIPVSMEWNCLGWQSFLLIIATLITGLAGRYTLLSKLEVLVLGLTSVFLINVTRLSVIFLLYYKTGQESALLFHDYGSVILTIVWLITFWWYVFNFVLTPQKA